LAAAGQFAMATSSGTPWRRLPSPRQWEHPGANSRLQMLEHPDNEGKAPDGRT
jgi:hypothetical protein